ncbi:MAG: LysM peptidoglycan-binding domain-containing protein [Algisphaera sp.]
MTAPYKIAVAAAATLLLVVIASLFLQPPPKAAGVDQASNAPHDAGATSSNSRNDRHAPNAIPATPSTPPATNARMPFDLPARSNASGSTADADSARFEYTDDAPGGTSASEETLTLGRDPSTQGPAAPSIFEPVPTSDDSASNTPPSNISGASSVALGPGDVITSPADPGQPSASNTPVSRTAAASSADSETYTIKGGDNLSSIALDLYGSATFWDEIAQANPLIDPNRLKVGQTIKLPPRPAPHTSSASPANDHSNDDLGHGTQYTVKENDTLSGIAKQFYAASSKWELIYQANRDVIGSDPGRMKAGTVLTIPPPDAGAR